MSCITVKGQIKEAMGDSNHRIGLQIGRANAFQLNRTYEYDANLFQIQYFYNLLHRGKFTLDLLTQPQVNITEFRFLSSWPIKSKSIEFGVNLGVVFRLNLFDDLVGLYAAGSIGPHYLSRAPNRQADGFIFSDNVFVGSHLKIHRNIYFDFRIGLRHISNAGLKDPNAGINNFIISGGFLINLVDKN